MTDFFDTNQVTGTISCAYYRANSSFSVPLQEFPALMGIHQEITAEVLGQENVTLPLQNYQSEILSSEVIF